MIYLDGKKSKPPVTDGKIVSKVFMDGGVVHKKANPSFSFVVVIPSGGQEAKNFYLPVGANSTGKNEVESWIVDWGDGSKETLTIKGSECQSGMTVDEGYKHTYTAGTYIVKISKGGASSSGEGWMQLFTSCITDNLGTLVGQVVNSDYSPVGNYITEILTPLTPAMKKQSPMRSPLQYTFAGMPNLVKVCDKLLNAYSDTYDMRGMFMGCKALESVGSKLLPSAHSHTYMFRSFFQQCTSLVNLPADLLSAVRELPEEGCSHMFSGCAKLASPAPMTELVSVGKRGCDSMYSGSGVAGLDWAALFPNLTSVGDIAFYQAFYACKGITHVDGFLKGLVSTGKNGFDSVFSDCSGLTKIQATPTAAVNEFAYRNAFSGTAVADASSFDLLSALTSAPTGAFQSMFNNTPLLTPVVMPPAGEYGANSCRMMYMGCTQLKAVPPLFLCQTVGESAFRDMFSGCTSLTDVGSVFRNTLENVDRNAFDSMFRGCTALQAVNQVWKFDGEIGQFALSGSFYGCDHLIDASRIQLPDLHIDNVTPSMFANCARLERIPQEMVSVDWFNAHNAQSQMFYNDTKITAPVAFADIPAGWAGQD